MNFNKEPKWYALRHPRYKIMGNISIVDTHTGAIIGHSDSSNWGARDLIVEALNEHHINHNTFDAPAPEDIQNEIV